MDTISALSSGTPPAAISIIRISGPRAFAISRAMVGTLPAPRQAALRAVRDENGDLLDRALVLCFPCPASATGEDLVELHCHGGWAVGDAVLRCLADHGVRPAVAGEFTRRALLNGRIDLAQAEGLADLLSAETEHQRRAALGAAEGDVGRAVKRWIERIALLSACAEALLDFAEEGDVAVEEEDRAIARIAMDARALGHEIADVAAQPTVERLRDGIGVVLAGPPNSGKSTLLNALTQREAAIDTPIAGTTRDRIDVPVSRNGVAYVLSDTAGLTTTKDLVERIGVDRAHAAIDHADLVIWTGDEDTPDGALWIRSRADLPDRAGLKTGMVLAVSAREPATLTALWAEIERRAIALLPRPDSVALNRRQHDLCVQARDALCGIQHHDSLLVAEHLRLAHSHLAAISGADHTEQMLTALFARFCIGK